jgi:hypothetical protein
MSKRVLRSTAIKFELVRFASEFSVLFQGTERSVGLEYDRTESVGASGLKVNERVEGRGRRERRVVGRRRRRRRRGGGEGGGASGLGERSGGGEGGGESLSSGELRGRGGSIATRFSKAVVVL